MKHPEVGKRDAKGRRFLGWTIRRYGDNGVRLVPTADECKVSDRRSSYRVTDAQWLDRGEHPIGLWQTASDARTWARKRSSLHSKLQVVPVYRPESKTRRVLRELVASVRECDPCLGKDCKACAALTAAKKLLEGT